MSIFDITPVGAYMNAMQVANAKDRQNARRMHATATEATPVMHVRVAKRLHRVWTRVLDAAGTTQTAATRSSRSA